MMFTLLLRDLTARICNILTCILPSLVHSTMATLLILVGSFFELSALLCGRHGGDLALLEALVGQRRPDTSIRLSSSRTS